MLNYPIPRPAKRRKSAYIWDERYLFHDPGFQTYGCKFIQPFRAYDNPRPKHRLHNLLVYSGITEKMQIIRPRFASETDLRRIHTSEYIERVKHVSNQSDGGSVGDDVCINVGGFEIASLAAGGALEALDAIIKGSVDNAYVMIRPPGHHALPDSGMGFCVFNNIAVCAMYAREVHKLKRIAILDYDVHHGNGTQSSFYHDPDTLVIDIHEDNNYPSNSGHLDETGGPGAEYSQINIPIPPGSGQGCYHEATSCMKLAVDKFQPELILVSSGYDANFNDPLGSMLLSSEDFRALASAALELADKHCHGRVIFIQEGGYSETYVPFCGLAVVEALVGERTPVKDPFLDEAHGRGYRSLQSHQAQVLGEAYENITKMPSRDPVASAAASHACHAFLASMKTRSFSRL